MKSKKVKELTNAQRTKVTQMEPLKENIFRDGVMVVTNYALLRRNTGIMTHQPYRAKEPRFLLATSGEAEVEINGIGFQIHANSVMVVPECGTAEILSVSKDFNGYALTFPMLMCRLECLKLLSYPRLLAVSDMEAELLKDWFRLLHTLFSQPEENGEMTEQMVAFVLEYLLRLHRKDLSGHRLPTCSQETFNEFVSMVNLKVRRERNVAYYAGMLGVTVNYLTVVVKKFGCRSAKEWIEAAVVREAKMMLKASQDNLETISAALGFNNAAQFGTFFKKETGMTPMEYRNSQAV